MITGGFIERLNVHCKLHRLALTDLTVVQLSILHSVEIQVFQTCVLYTCTQCGYLGHSSQGGGVWQPGSHAECRPCVHPGLQQTQG